MTEIRNARSSDRPMIMALAETSGLFCPEEIAFFADDFDDWGPDDPRLWLIANDGAVAAQVAPEAISDNVWNMLFIATLPAVRRHGLARDMINTVAAAVTERGGRLLLIDTASLDEMAPARALYRSMGFAQEATIRDYYGDGIARVTFARRP